MKQSSTYLLARLAVLASLGKHNELAKLAKSGLQRNVVEGRSVTETFLEVQLFAGFPAAIEAFSAVRPFLPAPAHPKSPSMSLTDRRKRGRYVCRQVYGRKYEVLMDRMNHLNPEFADWILEDGYGKVLSRGGLSVVERELIAISVLAALGWKKQLASHIVGSINVGATRQSLESLLESVSAHLPAGRRRHFGNELRRIFSEKR